MEAATHLDLERLDPGSSFSLDWRAELITGGSVYLFSSFSFCPFLTDKRSWLRVWRSRRIPLLLLPLLVWIKAHQDHESSPLRDSNLGFTELDLNLRSDQDYSVPGSDRVTSGPVWTGPGTGVIFDSVRSSWCWFGGGLLSSCRRPGLVRSRWSSGWTDQGGTGRWRSSTPWARSWAGLDHIMGGQGKTDEFTWTLHWAKVACMRGPCDPSGLTLATLYNPSRGLQGYSFEWGTG